MNCPLRSYFLFFSECISTLYLSLRCKRTHVFSRLKLNGAINILCQNIFAIFLELTFKSFSKSYTYHILSGTQCPSLFYLNFGLCLEIGLCCTLQNYRAGKVVQYYSKHKFIISHAYGKPRKIDFSLSIFKELMRDNSVCE